MISYQSMIDLDMDKYNNIDTDTDIDIDIDIDKYTDKNKDIENYQLCTICTNPFSDESKITLKCNHSFCYECLLESYKGSKCNYGASKNYRICPYCRTPSGYLPVKIGIKLIKGIHHPREFCSKISKAKGFGINKKQCLGIVKSGPNKGNQCNCQAKPSSDYCGRHLPKNT